VEGLTSDCHVNFQEALIRPTSLDTKNANASIAAVIVTATPEPVFRPTYRFDS
jgi:hypothetical protein